MGILVGGRAKPFESFECILAHALTVAIYQNNIYLSWGISFVRR